MNQLLEVTKTDILIRRIQNQAYFFDKYVLSAINEYSKEGSMKAKAQRFFRGLSGLWKQYEKKTIIAVFYEYLEMEIGLERTNSSHTSHINHIIQEFLLGYNILSNWKFIKDNYKDSNYNKRRWKYSEFSMLMFSWMAASLLHDIGYDIERASEEEQYRKRRNKFWNFMTKRITNSESLSINENDKGEEIIHNFILPQINNIPGIEKINYLSFKKLFRIPLEENKSQYKYDHGIISAIKYYYVLLGLQSDYVDLEYLNWKPNKHAALAMAVHNFRHKPYDLKLKCSNESSIIAYILIICDEIQDWERNRYDCDAINDYRMWNNSTYEFERRNFVIKLDAIKFDQNQAYILLNHVLNDDQKQFKSRLKKDIEEKVRKQMIVYPIKFEYHVDKEKATEEFSKEKCKRELLIPLEEDMQYKIYVEHKINNEEFMAISFLI